MAELAIEDDTEETKQEAPEAKQNEIAETEWIANSIQIASDIHLEFGDTINIMKKVIPRSPVLALCGDIGWPNKPEYTAFLKDMSSKFKYVIVLSGNHEYYYGEYHAVNDQIRSITQSIGNNVYFLQRDCLELDDVLPNIRILGTTLWCDYEKKAHQNFKQIVNDFQRVYWNKNYSKEQKHSSKEDEKEAEYPLIEPSQINKIHKEDVAWIKRELQRAQSDGKRVVVLSHHAPTDFGCVGYDKSKHPVAYSTQYSNLEYLFNKPLVAWFFGHTHYNADIVVRTEDDWFIRYATNQSGYQYTKIAQYYVSSKVVALHENDYWIEYLKGNPKETHEVVIKFSDCKQSRNVAKVDEHKKEKKLHVTMIEYTQLMQQVNVKKDYLPKDAKNGDCTLM